MGNFEKATGQDSLLHDCARFILGETTTVRLRGRPEVLEVLREALTASRDLYQALEAGRPLSDVRALVSRKARAAEGFRRLTGTPWRL